LEKSKSDKAYKDHPRLPAVELVVVICDGADDELHGGFGKEKAMGRENSANASICHALNQPNSVRMPRVDFPEEKGAGHDDCYNEQGSDEPYEELVATQKEEQLI
jgi:hypothetical protein